MSQDFDVCAVGDFGPRDEWNPAYVAKGLSAWPLLRQLNHNPAPAAALAGRCDLPLAEVERMLASLLPLGVVHRTGDQYRLGFGWFTAADQDLINEAVLPVARELAARIYARRSELDRFVQQLTAMWWSDPRDLRFALVGCFGLDWGGLDALKASGHLVHRKPQPGGREYVLYVQDRVERYNQKDYIGSHTAWAGETYAWTTFGDHSGRRFGLPDLLWQLRGSISKAEPLPSETRLLLGDLVEESLYAHLGAAAESLVEVAQGRSPQGIGLMLVQAAAAVEQGKPAIPIFRRSVDGAAMDGVVGIVREALLDVVNGSYAALERELKGLCALRNGVAFGECFNHIWHTLFGHTNRLLAQEGYLADPEPTHPGEGRYRWWLTVHD